MRNYRIGITLPDEKFTELLGSAICFYNYNVSFIIENILNSKITEADWWELNQKNGFLLEEIKILFNICEEFS